MRNLNREAFRLVSDAETKAAREQEATVDRAAEENSAVATVDSAQVKVESEAIDQIRAEIASLSAVVASLVNSANVKNTENAAVEAVVEG